LTRNPRSYFIITFEGSTWQGVQAFLSQLRQNYSSVKCRTFQVEEGEYFMNCDEVIGRLKQPWSFAEICADEINATVRKLEIQFSAGESVSVPPFVEIDFLAQDLKLPKNEIEDFVSLLENWRKELEAIKYYVRYANSMWELGDESFDSGVIFTSDIYNAKPHK
jgi:hypothetical protein